MNHLHLHNRLEMIEADCRDYLIVFILVSIEKNNVPFVHDYFIGLNSERVAMNRVNLVSHLFSFPEALFISSR